MPPLKTLIRSVCVCVCVSTKQQILHFHGCILLTKTIHLIFWGGKSDYSEHFDPRCRDESGESRMRILIYLPDLLYAKETRSV